MVGWTLWSALTHETLKTSYGFFALLDRIVVPFVLFALAPVLFGSEADRRLLLRTLTVMGLYLGATAVFEMLGPSALVFPRYVMDPHVGILFGRARGPLVDAGGEGLVLGACLFASVAHAFRSRGVWRVLALVAGALSALGVLLCLTRAVWIGALLGLVVVVGMVPVLRRRAPALALGVVAAMGGLLLAVPSLASTITDRLTTERSVYDRQNTNAAALRIIADHPIDGIGWTRFVSMSANWVRQADTYPVTNVDIEVHNVVLSRAAELGLVGAALWVACVLAGPVRGALRRATDPDIVDWRLILVGYGCVWAVSIMLSPVPYALANNLLWVFAGIVLREQLLRPSSPERAVPATG
jgi:O-antigen ligase